MGVHEITIVKGSKWENFGPAGSRLKIRRTHAPYIHPTKGYRAMATPRKTNARRRPIIAMGLGLIGCTEYNRRNPGGGRWRKLSGELLRKFRAFARRTRPV